jgi:hypothetical protein
MIRGRDSPVGIAIGYQLDDPPSAEVKKEYSYTSNPPPGSSGRLRCTFTFS